MPKFSTSSRGRFIPTLFAIADVALVNIFFGLLCTIFPYLSAQCGTWPLWLLVNLSLLPELWWGLRNAPTEPCSSMPSPGRLSAT